MTPDTIAMLSPATSLTNITGIGPKLAQKLGLLGLSTVSDLIYYFPRAWEDLTNLTPIAHLRPDGERHTVRAKLVELKAFRSPRKRMHITQGVIRDDSGQAGVVWFNQPYLARSLTLDSEYFFTGKSDPGQLGASFVSPTYEPVGDDPLHSGRIVAIYPESGGISTKVWRKIVDQAKDVISQIEDPLPEKIRARRNLLPLAVALMQIHFPDSLENLQAAKDRLGFDELLITQLAVGQMKSYLKTMTAEPVPIDIPGVKEILTHLPFELTPAQKKALWEILQDMSKEAPTNRLLEGDVGSGKTIVATIAMAMTAKHNFQATLMAPTEVLALQHYRNLSPLLAKIGIETRLHTRTYTDGPETAPVIIGTHALIQSGVEFDRLNLVVVDEQHRFGVKQREALRKKGQSPHFVSLTATPIPRSLALTIFGDLDLSVIATKPSGRKPITSQLVTKTNRAKVYELIRSEIAAGRQVFVVAPVISQDNKLNLKSAEQIFETVQKDFPRAVVGLLHGRLSSEDKNQALTDFTTNKTNILVATTVIEVGIDIPNATIMLIEQAERFGLAQLHQLRGRVGRGADKSYCFVSPETEDPEGIERLNLFCSTEDGFKLAEADLALRGPGRLFGATQSGFLNYRLANWTDANAIKQAQEAANEILTISPDLSAFPTLALQVEQINLVHHNE